MLCACAIETKGAKKDVAKRNRRITQPLTNGRTSHYLRFCITYRYGPNLLLNLCRQKQASSCQGVGQSRPYHQENYRDTDALAWLVGLALSGRRLGRSFDTSAGGRVLPPCRCLRMGWRHRIGLGRIPAVHRANRNGWRRTGIAWP